MRGLPVRATHMSPRLQSSRSGPVSFEVMPVDPPCSCRHPNKKGQVTDSLPQQTGLLAVLRHVGTTHGQAADPFGS